MFTFQELCGRPVAAADYIAVAQRYHTVAISGVPAFKAANRPDGYRFVTLIDVMYEHRCGGGGGCGWMPTAGEVGCKIQRQGRYTSNSRRTRGMHT